MKALPFLLQVCLPLSIGAAIYIFLRGNNERTTLPDFATYSLPDGLWLFSLNNLLSLIWNAHTGIYALWAGVTLLASLGTELLQYKGILVGTGDLQDCLAYILAFLASYYIHKHKTKQQYVTHN